MQRKRTATALLFLAGLLGGLIILASSFFGQEGHLEAACRGLLRDPGTLGSFLVEVEGAANQDLDRSHLFIQVYGGIQRLLGREVVVDMADPDYSVVKLSDGSLAFENLQTPAADATPNGYALADFAAQLKERFDLPLLYIQAPQKVEDGLLPTGVTDYGNQNADKLLAVLEAEGVDHLDLRPGMREAMAETGERFFFRTDHHWTPEGGFEGYRELISYLGANYGFTPDEAHADPSSYERTVYEDIFLGSQGKRVGSLYAGVDDITLWKPKFETSFTYSVPLNAIERTGPFEESLLFPERVAQRDWFGGNPYTLYAGGDYNLARMTNHFNPDGPRVLLIRDSFSCVLAPFLALDCSEVVTIDLRYFKDDLMDYMEWLNPDLVCVMYTASSTRLPELFQFHGAEDKPEFRY